MLFDFINKYELFLGDCLEEMNKIPTGSIDAIIADPPYGTTACSWDTVIPFEPMWTQFKRVIKDRGAMVLFGSEPFSSMLRLSNLDWYKYDWVWDKRLAGNFLNCNRTPLMIHEMIHIFSSGQANYNPQMRKGKKRMKGGNPDRVGGIDSPYGKLKESKPVISSDYYPTSILNYSNGDRTNGANGLHPTQKPIALMEYLVKTYTNPGDTVLDFTMGSGTTGVAAMKTGRNFIGIELDPGYFEIAQERIKNAAGDYVTTEKERATGQISIFDKLV